MHSDSKTENERYQPFEQIANGKNYFHRKNWTTPPPPPPPFMLPPPKKKGGGVLTFQFAGFDKEFTGCQYSLNIW